MEKKPNMNMKDVERLKKYTSSADLTKPVLKTEILEKGNKNLTLNFKGNKKISSRNNNGINYIPSGTFYTE